jgi:hypothetical protein
MELGSSLVGVLYIYIYIPSAVLLQTLIKNPVNTELHALAKSSPPSPLLLGCPSDLPTTFLS